MIKRINEIPKIEGVQNLPGADLILAGLEEINTDTLTELSFLIHLYRPRFERLGFSVPNFSTAKFLESANVAHLLYEFLEAQDFENAYSKYNSLLNRASSFASSLELLCERGK